MGFPDDAATAATPIADAERDEAIDRLRAHYASDRLSLEEFTDRLDRVFAAGTSSDLHDALAGLPASIPTRPGGVAARSGGYERVMNQLAPDERVYWVGQPDPEKRFSSADWFLVPFSVMWCGFAIFWEAAAIAGAARHAGSIFFPLWGIPFVAAGLYMVFGRFVVNARVKKRTLYALTDRRALQILRRRNQDSVTSVYLSAVPAVSVQGGTGRAGTVVFGNPPPRNLAYTTAWLPLTQPTGGAFAFLDVSDAGGVARLADDLIARRKG